MQDSALLWIKGQCAVTSDHRSNQRKSTEEYAIEAAKARIDFEKRKDEAIDALRILLDSKKLHKRTTTFQWVDADRALQAVDEADLAYWRARGGL